MGHTPMPWEHDQDSDNIYDMDGDLKATVFDGNNAAFIVKAVNNHYQLLGTIRSIKANLDAGEISLTLVDQLALMAEKAIKQAETEK